MAKSKPTNPGTSKQIFNLEEIAKAALVLRSLNHKTRQSILNLLDSNAEMKVSDIYKKMKLEQSLTSSFLGLLRKAGVVTTRREGQVIFYAVNHKRLAEIERGAKLVIGSR